MQLPQRWAIILLAATSLLLVQCDDPQSASLEQMTPFYGTFQGSGEATGKGEISARDLKVTIKPWEDKGFTVDWSTVIYRDGGEKRTSESINFYPAPRPGIFASAMRMDMFGNAVPYSPVDEDAHPYVWAGLKDKTLTVSALYVTDGGDYEMQVYKRSLQGDGLLLDFARTRNGQAVSQISVLLERAGQ